MASAQPSEIKDEQRIQASYFESFVANNSHVSVLSVMVFAW